MQMTQITINFKDTRRQMEWEGGKLHPKLQGIVLWVAWWWNRQAHDITVTHIFRTHQEQMVIYGADTDKTSLHELWRAVDLSVRDLPEQMLADFLEKGNKMFPYDTRRPTLKTFLRHNMGEGDHIHVRVME